MKKVLTGFALLAGILGTAFATPIPQTGITNVESATSASTAGLFGTDVDDYISVIDWKNVQPEHFFGFLGVGNGDYNMGGAHTFDKFYWGTNFGGSFSSYTSTTYSGGGESAKVSNLRGTTSFHFDNIIGLGSFGIMPGFKYYDNNSSEDETADPKTKTEAHAFQLSVSAGTTFEKDENKYSPYGKVWYGYNYDEANNIGFGTKVKDGLNTTCSDFGLLAGIRIDLKKKSDIQHQFDLSAVFDAFFPGSDSNQKGMFISPRPYYTLTYTTDETKYGVAVKLGLPGIIAFNRPSTITPGAAGNADFSFYLGPKVTAAAYYWASPKLRLNAGMDYAIVAFTYEHVEADGGKADTINWDGNDGAVTLTSGFTVKFTEKFALDFAWNILASIFGTDFESDFSPSTTANGSDVFFHNMNKIFTNISLMITTKL